MPVQQIPLLNVETGFQVDTLFEFFINNSNTNLPPTFNIQNPAAQAVTSLLA